MKILINPLITFSSIYSFLLPKNLLALLLFFSLSIASLAAQPGVSLAGDAASTEVCPEEPCPCDEFLQDLSLYYFGEDNVTIDVYRNASENQLITSFANVNSGDLLYIDGSSTLNNRLGTYTYLRITNPADEYCTTRIFSRCPSNAWPGALEDLKIMGKTFGDFVVYAYTDTEASECTIADTDQDWHVGGNVVGPANKTMGTRNDEDVVFISHDTGRGTITRTGEWGVNTLTPGAQLDVQGDAIIEETLDVNGIARMNAGTPSNSPANGALIVNGGTGISENINIGNNANVGNSLDVINNGRIGNDLSIGRDAAVGQNLDVINDGTIGNDLGVGRDLDVVNNGTIGSDLEVGHDLDVLNNGIIGNDLGVGNNLDVISDASIGNNLSVGQNALISNNLDVVNDAQIDNNLNVDNNATIDQDLSVGANTAVGGNLAVNQSASISVDATIGNDLDVTGDAHVDGTVTIGTNSTPNMLGTVSTSAYQLFVNGGILTEEVLVRTGWADYVFEADYDMMSLEQVAEYVAQEGHLPNTPSTQDVEQNGLGLGSMAVLQQEKIEELFLHLIEMNEALKALQLENNALKVAVEKLR